MVAKALKKPFYVAAESYKFARLFPLTQSGMYGGMYVWMLTGVILIPSTHTPMAAIESE
jgi:hypothetical protein